MTFEQHSLTLHFGEADEECWELLKELSRDQQESVIKEALKLYLGVQLESLRPKTTQERESTLVSANKTDEIGLSSDWKLDSLFVSSENKKEITDPLKHLFQIIGEEDDEEVIDFLSTSAKTVSTVPSVPREGESPKGNDPSEIGTEETIPIPSEGQLEGNLVISHGLSFILQQVIGEEEDEGVLEFFENSRKSKPDF